MNEKQRERPENINHGATYGNRRLSILPHPVIKARREGNKEDGKQVKKRECGGMYGQKDRRWDEGKGRKKETQ